MGFRILQPIQSIKMLRLAFQSIAKDADGDEYITALSLSTAKVGFDSMRSQNVRIVIFDSKEDMEWFEEVCTARSTDVDTIVREVARESDAAVRTRMTRPRKAAGF